jgi:hypothetical protein
VKIYGGFSNYMRKENCISCSSLHRVSYMNLTIFKNKFNKNSSSSFDSSRKTLFKNNPMNTIFQRSETKVIQKTIPDA